MAIRIIDFATGFQTDELPGTAVDASTITVEPVGNLESVDLQSALEEHQADIDGLVSQADATDSTVTAQGQDIELLQVDVVDLDARIDVLEPIVSDNTTAIATKADAASTTASLATKLAHTGGTATNLKVVDRLTFVEGAKPATPALGEMAFFAKDGKFYQVDDADVESLLGGGGLTPDQLTALPGTLVNGTDYQVAQTATTNAALPVTALAATIKVTDALGACSASKEIGITAGSGQSIRYRGQLITGVDRFVMRRANVSAEFAKEAGSTVWDVTYQTVSVPQGGQIPANSGASAIPYPNAGYVNRVTTTTNNATSAVFFNVASLVLQPGSYDVSAVATMTSNAANVIFNRMVLGTSLQTSGTLSYNDVASNGSVVNATGQATMVIPCVEYNVAPGTTQTVYVVCRVDGSTGVPIAATITAKLK